MIDLTYIVIGIFSVIVIMIVYKLHEEYKRIEIETTCNIINKMLWSDVWRRVAEGELVYDGRVLRPRHGEVVHYSSYPVYHSTGRSPPSSKFGDESD